METRKLLSRQFPKSPLTKYTRNLLKKINRIIDEYKLISEGDRICVSVSGGKDSLSLLYLLLEHIRFYSLNYTVSAVHVVSDIAEQKDETKNYLKNVISSLGIPFDFIEISVTSEKDGKRNDPTCFWCSWKRREALFKHVVQNGYNKLALGHHADDVAETTLLNLLFHGTLDTIIPLRQFFDGKFDIIRPLFYVRERELIRFASLAGFSSSTCTCHRAEYGKRQVMKKLVRNLTKESRHLHANLWNAAHTWYTTIGDHPLHSNHNN